MIGYLSIILLSQYNCFRDFVLKTNDCANIAIYENIAVLLFFSTLPNKLSFSSQNLLDMRIVEWNLQLFHYYYRTTAIRICRIKSRHPLSKLVCFLGVAGKLVPTSSSYCSRCMVNPGQDTSPIRGQHRHMRQTVMDTHSHLRAN